MIFVTVGTQLPFDRLIRYIDEMAPDLPEPVFAQIGMTSYVPKNIKWSALVSTIEFNAMMKVISVIVGHAGIGTIIAAQQHAKPLVLMPRLASQREHRNDHQIATVNSLRHRSGIYVADSETELHALLLRRLDPPNESQVVASRDRLISVVSRCIHT